MYKSVEVRNVRCDGCANTIVSSLQKEGFTDVSVDLSCEPRVVRVHMDDEALLAHLVSLLRELGYPLVSESSGFVDSATLKAKSFISCATGKFKPLHNQS